MNRPSLALYGLLFVVMSPVIAVAIARRSDTRRRWRELLALDGGPHRPEGPGAPTGSPRVWLHAVSVGEVLASLPVLTHLRLAWPTMEVHLTSTIEDALAVAATRDCPLTSSRLLPLDLPFTMDRLIGQLEPDLVLLSETDFWPVMADQLVGRNIPFFLVNGRISHKIHGLFSRLGSVSTDLFGSFRHAFVQSTLDADRLSSLGTPIERISVVGNTKYEVALSPIPEVPLRISTHLDPGRARVIAGSTHPGEEERVIAAVAPPVQLVLAPRDVRRAGQVGAAARAMGRTVVTTSAPVSTVPADVVVVDELGVLAGLYGHGTVAYVGGGFDGGGGHNFLEAARHGVAIVVGPRMRNFANDVERFLAGGALCQVAALEDLGPTLRSLIADGPRASRMGAAARALLTSHGGAAAATAEGIRRWMGDLPVHSP